MNRRMGPLVAVRTIAAGLALGLVGGAGGAPDEPGRGDGAAVAAPEPLPTVDEARGRARLLHGTIHDTLQIVHARYYREDEGLAIPAAALERVFLALAERHDVEIRWLAVDAQVMNIDHKPRDEFEERAVKALGAGEDEFDLAQEGVYRYAGPITLGSECLKCHLPSRSSNASRRAGLVVSMPVRAQ